MSVDGAAVAVSIGDRDDLDAAAGRRPGCPGVRTVVRACDGHLSYAHREPDTVARIRMNLLTSNFICPSFGG